MPDMNLNALNIAEDCFAVRLRKLNREISAIYDNAFKASSVTIAQYNLLVAIAASSQASPTQLVKTLSLEKSTVSRNLARMQNNGWIETLPTKDGRAHNIRLSETGTSLLQQLIPNWQKAQELARKKLGSLTPLIESIELN